MSESSEQINELASALAKAQGKITGALKESKNPFFKSSYADLASCWDACRAPLSDNGLAVIQTTEIDQEGVVLVTTLAHSSGQWVRSRLRMKPADDKPQTMGSALTYARRYALTAIVGLAQVDDDGNAASGKGTHESSTKEGADPRGDIRYDTTERDRYVSRFTDAFDADVEEEEKAALVFAIHSEVASNSDLYIAIGDKLGNKGRTAIREYVKQYSKIKGMSPNGRAAA